METAFWTEILGVLQGIALDWGSAFRNLVLGVKVLDRNLWMDSGLGHLEPSISAEWELEVMLTMKKFETLGRPSFGLIAEMGPD